MIMIIIITMILSMIITVMMILTVIIIIIIMIIIMVINRRHPVRLAPLARLRRPAHRPLALGGGLPDRYRYNPHLGLINAPPPILFFPPKELLHY